MAGEELYEANQQECHEADGVSENGEELEVAHAPWCVTRPIGCKVGQTCVCYFLRRIDADFSQQFDLLKNEMLPESQMRLHFDLLRRRQPPRWFHS
jgi:hypothetical protein